MLKKLLQNPVFQTATVLFGVFVLQFSLSQESLIEKYFILSTPLEIYPWTIKTNIYSHAGFGHFSSNLIALLFFGLPIARLTSVFRFHSFFIIVGSLAGISQVLTLHYLAQLGIISLDPIPGVLGASGAIFGLMGYFLVSNSASTFVSSFINPPSYLRYSLYIGLAFSVTIATASPGAALIAHFVGFLLGLLAGKKKLLKS